MSFCFMTPLLKKNQEMLKKDELTIGKLCSNSAAGKDNRQLCMLQLLQACTKAHHSLTTAFISAFRRLERSQIDKILERQVLAGKPSFISLTQMLAKQTRDTNEYTNTCTRMLLLVCTSTWVTMKVHRHINCRAGANFFLE